MDRNRTAQSWLEQITHRLNGLSETQIRVHFFATTIGQMPPLVACDVFERIVTHGIRSRDYAAKRTLEVAMITLAQKLWERPHQNRTAMVARSEGRQLVTLMLSDTPEEKSPEASNSATFQVPSYGFDRLLTLGERRSLATRPDRRFITHATQDPHPMVTKRLLGNPKLTESDVIRMAARRPSPPNVLTEIGRHPKWRIRQGVANAIVKNPHSPPFISITLLPTLATQTLAEIGQETGLAKPVRKAATLLVALQTDDR